MYVLFWTPDEKVLGKLTLECTSIELFLGGSQVLKQRLDVHSVFEGGWGKITIHNERTDPRSAIITIEPMLGTLKLGTIRVYPWKHALIVEEHRHLGLFATAY